jgi:hypothetical protein
MSQAPGLSGMPVSGHRSSAAHQCLLREILRQAHVANHAHEATEEPGGFDPPDRLDGRAVASSLIPPGSVSGLLRLRLRLEVRLSSSSLARSSGVNSGPKSSAS